METRLAMHEERASESRQGDGTAVILAFTPVSGGCGSSTMAAASALYFAARGKRTLYLNLEQLGSADLFFHGEGQFTLSDIIFALKDETADVSSKLESCVRRDPRGVFFFSRSSSAPDMLQLSPDALLTLVRALRQAGSYDVMILDLDFSLDRNMLEVYRQAHTWVWVGDGSEASNEKITRAFAAITALEQTAGASLTGRLALLYNKFNSNTGKTLTDIGVRTVGGAPKYELAATAQVLRQLTAMSLFDRLLPPMTQAPPAAPVPAAPPAAPAPAARPVTPCLLRKRGGEKIPITKPVFYLGRDVEGNDHAITDNIYVGHRHCHIVSRGGEFFVVDDNSKNRTFIDGTSIPAGQEVRLTHGCTLRLANEDFEFRLY